MSEALQVMFYGLVIMISVSMMIALLIQILGKLMDMGSKEAADDDGQSIALAIAVALSKKDK